LAAGVAALGSYEDDDLDLLRALSSNATGNGTATTVAATTVPATTVAATTVAATTVAASGNATTAAATTVATNATTTGAPSGGGGGNGGPSFTATAICDAATYTGLGFADPGTLTQTTLGIYWSCPGLSDTMNFQTAETSFYDMGPRAFTAENKAKCTKTVEQGKVEFECSASPTAQHLTLFNSWSLMDKAKVLEKCCTVAPVGAGIDPPALEGTLSSNPNFRKAMYKTSTCTDANLATPAEIKAFDGGDGWLFAAGNPLTISSGACFDGSYGSGGSYIKVSSCNSTDPTGANRWRVREHHLEAGCASSPMFTDLALMKNCEADVSGNTTMYVLESCNGGDPVQELEIKLALSVSLTNVGTLTAPQKDTVLSTTCTTLRDKTAAAAGAGTSTVESCTGTGPLSTATFTGRRVRRRLASHAATVDAIIKNVVPAASATTIKTSLTTAASSGALSSATLSGEVVTALQAESSIASAVSNITVTTAATVSAITLPTATTGGGGGGSTSGALTQAMGAVAGLLAMGALLI